MNEVSSVEHPLQHQTGSPVHDPDEINLLEYIYVLVKNKWLIVGFTLLGLVGGYLGALSKGPTWVAETLIAPKETETQKAPNLSSFGAFGGLVANQLNIGGNASLEKIELFLDSRDFNSRLIQKYDLLPTIYRYMWPKVYAQNWDSSSGKWKSTFIPPEPLGMGSFLKGTFVNKTINKNNTMTIELHSRDSALSINLAKMYVTFLDEDIKSTVRNDAKENVAFLEKQLITIADPLLREKIQGLIADEIEKTMLVSKEAFKVVDPVYLSKSFKEKKLYPMVLGAGLFFLTVLIVIFIHAFSSSDKTEEDLQLIEKIKKEILPGGKKR